MSGASVDNTVVVAHGRLLSVDWSVVIIADVKAKNCRVDVAVTPEEKGSEDWLGENVKNAVEDCLRIGRNNVSTLTQAPSDGVQEPQENGPSPTDNVCPGNFSAKRL